MPSAQQPLPALECQHYLSVGSSAVMPSAFALDEEGRLFGHYRGAIDLVSTPSVV